MNFSVFKVPLVINATKNVNARDKKESYGTLNTKIYGGISETQ